MKRLIIKTIRELTEGEYRDYKELMGHKFDFKELEKRGQIIVTTHLEGEKVETKVTLEELK